MNLVGFFFFSKKFSTKQERNKVLVIKTASKCAFSKSIYVFNSFFILPSVINHFTFPLSLHFIPPSFNLLPSSLHPILPLFQPPFSHISQSSPTSISPFFPSFDSPSFPALSFSLLSYLSTLSPPSSYSLSLSLPPSLPSSIPSSLLPPILPPFHPYFICPSLP